MILLNWKQYDLVNSTHQSLKQSQDTTKLDDIFFTNKNIFYSIDKINYLEVINGIHNLIYNF